MVFKKIGYGKYGTRARELSPTLAHGDDKNAKTMKQNEAREYIENKADSNYCFEGIIYGYGPPNIVS